MLHVSSRDLRRLADEPFAVPDRARDHRAGCGRCQAVSARLATNAALAERVLCAPAAVADIDAEWAALSARLASPAAAPGARNRLDRRPLPGRLRRVSLGTGVATVAAVLAVGAGAAAALTTIYAPTHVTPIKISAGDLRAIKSLTGLSAGQWLSGMQPTGSAHLAFGEVSWTTAGHPRQVSSIAQASALTHLAWSAPSVLPSGVGSASRIAIQPQVTASVTFAASAGPGIAGSTLQITDGPAIVAAYGGRSGPAGLMTLAIGVMQRPMASSTGATATELEDFLLAHAGLPAGLAQEVRLLGNPATTLPVPVPSGVTARQLTIGGAPAVLMTIPSGVASMVIWESKDGLVHVVAGLLDSKDILNVARQIG